MPKNSFDPGPSSALLAVVAGAVVFFATGSGQRLLGLELYGTEKHIYIVVVAAVAATLGVLSVRRARAHQKERQQERDRDAGSSAASFGLYLRPFFTGGKLPVPNAARSGYPLAPSHYTEDSVVDLEVQLARASERVFPLRAIGSGSIGAGKIVTSDATWQETFAAEARQAAVIFVVPLNQPGTRWEIRRLKQQSLLEKTVFIMPPQLTVDDRPMDQLWKQARDALVEDGLSLPEFRSPGMLFLLDDNGVVTRETAKHGFVDDAVRDLLLRLTGQRRSPGPSAVQSLPVAAGCGLLWALGMAWLGEIPNLISWNAAGLVLAFLAAAMSVYTVWPEFAPKHATRIVVQWWLAFFAGIAALALWEELLHSFLPPDQEGILASIVACLWGGYAWASVVRIGDALMRPRDLHRMAWGWILPVILTIPSLTFLWPRWSLPGGWAIAATVGVYVTLCIVRASGAVRIAYPHHDAPSRNVAR